MSLETPALQSYSSSGLDNPHADPAGVHSVIQSLNQSKSRIVRNTQDFWPEMRNTRPWKVDVRLRDSGNHTITSAAFSAYYVGRRTICLIYNRALFLGFLRSFHGNFRSSLIWAYFRQA